jgi:TetR/AcrR family transcriptional regulator, regulator of cefoperazone and chloramphenicol sensitivity
VPKKNAASPRIAEVSLDDLSTPARIREIALRLFAENGTKSTSLRAIAQEAGVSASLVIHHFGSKANLEKAVMDECMIRLVTAVHGVGSGENTEQALLARRAAYDELLRRQPYVARYVGRVLTEQGSPQVNLAKTLLASTQSEMDDMIAQGYARPMPDPDVGIVLYWLIGNARFFAGQMLESLVGLRLSDPADIERLARAEIDLLTDPLFLVNRKKRKRA